MRISMYQTRDSVNNALYVKAILEHTTSNRRTILHFTYGKFEIENGHIHARPHVLAYHESAFNDSKLNIYTYMKT